MAHSRLTQTTMYDWIERALTAGDPLPTDAQIVEHFGFDGVEQARTLLAALSDAGRITIRGFGDARAISLGRARSRIAPAARPVPSVTKADPVVDAGVARIREIVERGRHPAARDAPDDMSPPSQTPTPPRKDPDTMPAKTISLPATATVAIMSVEALARETAVSLGAAAASLIELGAGKVDAPAPRAPVADIPLERLLELVHARFDARPDHSAALADAVARAEVAEARAIAAETKLEQARALFA